MKTILKIIGLTLALTILWSLSIGVINQFTGLSTPEPQNPGLALSMLVMASLLICLPMYFLAHNLGLKKLPKFMVLWLTHYCLQFAFTQVETWYFLSESSVPPLLIKNVLISGLITSATWCLLLTAATGSSLTTKGQINSPTQSPWYQPMLAGAIIYPMLYFIFGYFVAWQFEAVRLYYTDSAELTSFGTIMKQNFQHGTYWFQVLRGIIWAYLGWLIYLNLKPTSNQVRMLILASLFALVMNAQLLLPNPYMPTEVRWAHALETASSNFLWGIVLAIVFKLKWVKNRVQTA